MSIQERCWTLWVMQTARHYGDISSIIHKTGIESIDNEHRTLVGQVLEINCFINSLDQSDFSLALVYQVGELCNRLRDITRSHFLNEEALFAKYNILGLELHQHKHKLILEELDEMIEDLDGGRLNVTLRLKEAILNWVVIHINEEDVATFGPENIAKTILLKPESKSIFSIFSNTGIPSLDQVHQQLHHTAADCDVSDEVISRLKKLLTLSLQIEHNLLERYKISPHQNYLAEHQVLSSQLQSLGTMDEKQRKAPLKDWYILWCCHHRQHHIEQFEVSNWILKAIQKSEQPSDLQNVFPKLNIEELDQGRIYTYRMIISIVKVFARLEAYDQHQPSILEMKSLLKKLRGHLRFQHEQEEDLLSHQPQHIQQLHREQHREWLKLLDYFAVLMESSKMALGGATLSKLISNWAGHLLFYDSPDLGPSP